MQLQTTISLYAGGQGSGCRGDNCGRKVLYHGTSVESAKDILENGFNIKKPSRTGMNMQTQGVSLTENINIAKDYGREILRVEIDPKAKGFFAPYSFWGGRSINPEHQQVYAEMRKAGVDPKNAEFGHAYENAIRKLGYKFWYANGVGGEQTYSGKEDPKGNWGEVRVLDDGVITKVERVGKV